ncbi:dihydroxyacetone kinase subunit DhaK [Rhodobacteraceae bacterium R_SAG2]|nr:dihydroxyacetone kinase subunit DhaK [Rhodobacteraceae bacterium R_SAG2]
MKKILNTPETYVKDALSGLVRAHPELTLGGESGRCVSRSTPAPKGHVGIATGGGFGHLPLFTGYVGEGLPDACAVGNVFEGPNAQSCLDAIRAADHGAGVLCLYGNYGGDRMNFDLAIDMADMEGISCRTVLGTDDIASAAPDEAAKRRGVAGLVLVYKCAGAAAMRGHNLDAVTKSAEAANAATRTIGVALAPCRVPTASEPNFSIGETEMEFGMGIHGEPGIWRAPLAPAAAVAREMVDRLIADQGLKSGDRVQPMLNGLGATPLEELFILWAEIETLMTGAGLSFRAPMIGNFVTSMEMAGASLTFMQLDEERETLLDTPASCPFWRVTA